MSKRWWILLVLAFVLLSLMPARAQGERDCNGFPCLDLIAHCNHSWQIVNSDPNWSGEVIWQIWSSYEWNNDEDPPIILYEGVVNMRSGPSRANFSVPSARPVIILRGPTIDDGPAAPSTRSCNPPPPRSCTNVFKITIPGELRIEGAQFVLYHVGDEFLDTYTDDDLGFDIQMGTVNPTTGQTALLLCQDAWPGARNFVGMIEVNGERTPIIEFSLGAEWPEVQVVWTAPGVENAV